MKVQGKIWGKTFDLFRKNNVEVHYIEVLQGGFCSKHTHQAKYNTFIILEGELLITVWKNDMADETILNAGQEYTVAPGDYHMFEANLDTKALEIYHVELDQNDIIRANVGGIKLQEAGWKDSAGNIVTARRK